MMHDRYSGRSAAMARSIAVPNSRASRASSADGERDDDLERRCIDLRSGRRVGRARHAHRRQPALPQMIDRQIVRDLEQPARQLELGGVALDVVERLDEGVLRELLRRLSISHHAIHEREHGPLVAAHQLPKRCLAPLLREDDDVRVGQIREIKQWCRQSDRVEGSAV